MWPNDLGLERAPISDRAYAVTLDAYQLVEQSEIEWLTWRPALVVLAGLATYAGVAARRRLRPLLWIGGLYVIHLANVWGTSPSHEWRYAYGLYLIALCSLPLWFFIVDPSRATIGPAEPGSAVGGAGPALDEAAGDPDWEPEDGDDRHIRVPDDPATGDAVDGQEHHRQRDDHEGDRTE